MILPTRVEIIVACARAFAVAPSDVIGKSRSRRIMRSRQAACLLLRWFMLPRGERRSLHQVAEATGLGDHSTAWHNCRIAMAEAASDPDFAEALARAARMALLLAEGEDICAVQAVVARVPQRAEQPAPRPVLRGQSTARLPRNRFDEDEDPHAQRSRDAMHTGSAMLADAILRARAVQMEGTV